MTDKTNQAAYQSWWSPDSEPYPIPSPPFKLELRAPTHTFCGRSDIDHRRQPLGTSYPASPCDEDVRPFPADFQIQRCSLLGLRMLSVMWYVFCGIAFAIIFIPQMRWNIYNICGHQYGCSLIQSMSSWNSHTCLQAPTSGEGLVWQTTGHLPTQRDLYQFRRVALRFPRPPEKYLTAGYLHLSARLLFYAVDATSNIVVDAKNSPTIAELKGLRMKCSQSSEWCDTLILPDGTASIGPSAVAKVQVFGLSDEMEKWLFETSDGTAGNPASSIPVGMIYQRPGYTLQLLIWRYLLLLVTVCRFLLFLALVRWSHMTNEQVGMLFLQIGLILYLNPLAALCVTARPADTVLAFTELHFPYFYFILVTIFVISVMVSALPWKVPEDKDAAQQSGKPLEDSSYHAEGVGHERCAENRSPSPQGLCGALSACLAPIRHYWGYVYMPYTVPRWITLLYVVFFFSVVVIDLVQLTVFSDTAYWTVNASPTKWSSDALKWVVEALIMLSCVIAWIIYLFLPQSFQYILIRARWLGVHMLMRIFLSLVFLIVAEIVAFNFFDPILAPGIVCNQPFVTLSSVLVSSAFLHAMLGVYMGTRRRPDLPIDAADHRWKQIVWPEEWIAWLRVQGNGQYIFFNEEEERTFCALQEAARAHSKPRRDPTTPAAKRSSGAGGAGATSRAVLEQWNDRLPNRSSAETPMPTDARFERLVRREKEFEQETSGPPPLFLRPAEEVEPSRSHVAEVRYTVTTLRGKKYPSRYAGIRVLPTLEIPLSLKQGPEGLFEGLVQLEMKKPYTFFRLYLYRFFYCLRGLLFRASDTWWSWFAPAPKRANEEEEERYQWDIQHFPVFFVLETAIDCCNLSAEVYNPVKPSRRREIANVEFLNPNMSTATLYSHQLRDRGLSEHRSSSLDASSPSMAVSQVYDGEIKEPASGWLNVEQYGFHLRAVKIVKKVQFLIAVMDLNFPAHAGKRPRIAISFRGTSRMSNVKKDSALWFVPFPEGEEWPHKEREKPMEREQSGQTLLHANLPQHDPLISTAESDHESEDASSLASEDVGDRDRLPETTVASRSPTMMDRLSIFYDNDSTQSPKVHAGFLSLWNDLRSHVRRKLRLVEREMDRREDMKDFEVVLTGHSLGGALAVLCAYHLSRWFVWRGGKSPRLMVYTYGQPRVGNVSFERTYDKYVRRSFQVVNENDIVAKACGGVSGGIAVSIDRHGNYIVQPSEAEEFIRPTSGKGLSVVHHLLSNYAVALNGIARDSHGTCKVRVGIPYLDGDGGNEDQDREHLRAGDEDFLFGAKEETKDHERDRLPGGHSTCNATVAEG